MDTAKEFLSNADIAFDNGQYEEALKWYRKALEVTPDDIYALSRAGAICVSLKKMDEALIHFGKAKELDPENGDNVFNYANACFYNNEVVKAFNLYAEAERIGCSEDVMPRLYYQMGLMCSLRQDAKAALIYLQKCEEADKDGHIALSSDMISEKIKLYMYLKDYDSAEDCASKLVAAAPTEFKNYMVYYGILMAHSNLAVAEKLLADAGKYVEMTDAERYAYVLQLAVLYVAEGASDPENSDEYYKKAIDILEKEMADGSLTSEQKSEMLIVLADVYSKVEDLDKAISILENLLYGSVVTEKAEAPEESFEIPAELTFEDIEDMLQNDMDNIQDKIDSGELDDDMGLYADVDYDENGEEVHYYDDSAFGTSEKTVIEDDNENTVEEEKVELTEEVREKVIFTLLTCYMAKDEFEKAQKLALILKDSSNKYYGYYGLYTEALTERKITGNSESANLKYAEAIAFFRNKTFADTKDVLASVFRARLYAEQGKFEKAEEIANLLADDDRASVMKYIAECKQ